MCAERARAGPGDNQPFGGELRQGPGHGHGAHPESLDKGPARRQLSTRRVAVELPPEPFRQFSDTATLVHESTE
ncbi:hypothetical protein GCM10010270_45200 [Streptomyces violaceus]|nr:hypothetical protein GCM10010270_45200 [Streptomyces janthinus]